MKIVYLAVTAFVFFCFSYVMAQSSAPEFKEKKIAESRKNFSIEIAYPLMTESRHQAGLEKFNSLIHNYFQSQVKEFRDDFRQGESAGVTDVPWSLYYSYEINYKSASLVSILFTGSNYCGGAHPSPIFYSVNFDLEKGRTVEMKDLFKKGSGYYEKMSAICISDLKKRDISSNNELINEGASSKAENFECFYFKSDRLVILFPPYQVAPYVAGPQEVMIPFRSLRDLIDPRSPAGPFIKHGE
ncbi:MAG: DUF3298 and DUF4163 domain-containing protein [Candidatus Xenobiia bacterium LiM19]